MKIKIKEAKDYKYPSTEQIKRMCDDALNQGNREDIIKEILHLKNV